MNTTDMLVFQNDGQDITSTNYWDSELAARGFLFLSWNAGAARVLLPDNRAALLEEMATARIAILSRGAWGAEGGRDAFELLFEDDTATPFSVILSTQQTDRKLPDNNQGGFPVTVWMRDGPKLRLPGRYREVTTLPCLAPWEMH